MLCIVAYHGLKARCIAVLLHTRMSHTGRTTSGWTSVLRRPEWNGDFEPDISALKGCCVPFGTRSATTEPVGETEPGLRSATVRRTNLYTIGLYYDFYCRWTDGCRPAFLQYIIFFLFNLLPADSADQSGHPHLLAGVSTTMISSMVTPKTAAKMTKLSIVGMAVPWIHL